jgi:glucose/arabinose dehydrogenase
MSVSILPTSLRRAIAAVSLAALTLGLLPVGASAGLTLTFDTVKTGLDSPLYLTNAGDSRLFVVEKGGDIEIIHNNLSVTTFLDISSKISTSGERGLLGLAFHPSYASNRKFYVVYTRASDGDIVIAEYERSASDADDALESSERILLTIEHSSATNHNGGWAGFKNNLLYIAIGDGGNTPEKAPKIENRLGKILRINPLDPDGAGPKRYTSPSTNPYFGRSGLDEIFARGLRNPWRCSFDSLTGALWCNDVGQSQWEEINRVQNANGLNFGWPVLEGFHKNGDPNPCTSNCRTLPIAEYSHTSNQAQGAPCSSTTGGYVSRRSGATLEGKYTFADYCSGKIWVISATHPAGTALGSPVIDTNYSIASFGVDSTGRIYVVDISGGIYRIEQS